VDISCTSRFIGIYFLHHYFSVEVVGTGRLLSGFAEVGSILCPAGVDRLLRRFSHGYEGMIRMKVRPFADWTSAGLQHLSFDWGKLLPF